MKIIKLFTSIVLLGIMSAAIFFAVGLPVILSFAVLFILSLLMPANEGALNTVVSNPLIGKSRKSMGNATFTTWKGLNVLKDKATSVANPNSDKQQMQRSAMRQIVEAFREMPSAIRAGYKKGFAHMSEFNRFTKQNLKNAFDLSAPPAATLVPANVLISKGTIAATQIQAGSYSKAGGDISVGWDYAELQPGQSQSDIGLMAAWNITKSQWTGTANAGTRLQAGGNLPIPEAWEVGDQLVVFGGFYNEISGESSDSTNITATIAA